MQKYFSVLSRCPLFRGVAEKDLIPLLNCMGAAVSTRDKGEALLMADSPADRVGVLLSGNAQVIREDYQGSRSILSAISPGQLFGEAFAFAQVEALPVSVICTERCEALFIPCDKLSSPCANACGFHNRMIFNLMQVMAQKNLLLRRKLEIVSCRTIRERLLTYLDDQARQHRARDFDIPFDRQALADYLGVERSALSAEISRLRAEGVLESDRKHFRLL